MKKFAKIINEETKAVVVGMGTNESFYRSEGMSEMDVEQGYDGNWYVAGFAPEKPDDVKKSEIRAVRNQYLADTDKYMIADYPITEEERAQYKAYRQYLRDYTKTDGWFDKEPAAFVVLRSFPFRRRLKRNKTPFVSPNCRTIWTRRIGTLSALPKRGLRFQLKSRLRDNPQEKKSVD